MKKFLRIFTIFILATAVIAFAFVGCNAKSKAPESSNFMELWSDNAEVSQANAKLLAEARALGTKIDGSLGTVTYTDANGEEQTNNLFSVYKNNEDGRLFIISGCNIVYLTENGNVPANALRTLRLEESNIKVNVYSDANFYAEAQKMAKTFIDETGGGRTAITPIGEREAFRSKGIGESYLTGSKTIWLNGQATSFHADQSYISLEGLIKLGIESGVIMSGDEYPCVFNNRQIVFTINTAGGKMTVEITRDGDNVPDVTTKTLTNEGKLIEKSFKDAATFQSIGGQFSMGFESIQEILGWDLDVYDNSINVVTDIQDIQSPDTIILSSNVTAVTFVKEDLGVEYEVGAGTTYTEDGVDFGDSTATYVRRGNVTYSVVKDKNGNRLEIPNGEAWNSLTQEEMNRYNEALGANITDRTDDRTWREIQEGPISEKGKEALADLASILK